MNKIIILALFAVTVLAGVPALNQDLTGTYSLWRPPTWPNFETCCYLQGANITVVGDVFTLKSLVMGPCAQYLPGANGLANMQLQGNLKNVTDGTLKVTMKFFTMAGLHTMDKEYVMRYSVELTPAPVDILTFTQTTDTNCTFELRNDTKRSVQVVKLMQSFLSSLEQKKVQAKTSSKSIAGKYSLWRPPTWQNFSTCCYMQGANVTQNTTTLNYDALVMGPCADYLPGTKGKMTATVNNGTVDDKVFQLQSTFYTTTGRLTLTKTFTVTQSVELTPAPVNLYTYHDNSQGSDLSCDFILRQDTQSKQ